MKAIVRPIWLQAWGGTNTIARALKTIEQEHPEKMEAVAHKMRFFFIWEQDSTYQNPTSVRIGVNTISSLSSPISSWAHFYQLEQNSYRRINNRILRLTWMKANILDNHGPLVRFIKPSPGSHGLSGDTNFKEGDFRSEGDSPAFLHFINTGLRSIEITDLWRMGRQVCKSTRQYLARSSA